MNIKKQVAVLTVIGLVFGNVVIASAQTPTATTTSATALQTLIQTLQKQIESLNAQIQTLKNAQTQLQSATSTEGVVNALQLIGQLREGSSGEKVRILQAILASDASIYPEGNITGYYGRLTAEAVKRFQKKNGIEQAGVVGKKTLEKIEKELKKNPVAMEVRDGKKVPCAIVPPGHLIAEGWLRKMNGIVPIIPVCQKLPEGVERQMGTATTTPDVKAPIISDVEAKKVIVNGATIVWETNEPATSVVLYGTTTPATTGNALSVSVATLVKEHSVVLSGLTANTTYYYLITSTDKSGNVAKSAQYSFVTPAMPDITAPVFSDVKAVDVTASSSRITWMTNEPATGKIWYATSTPVVTTGSPLISNATLSTAHSSLISGLATSTTYYYVVSSADASGNTATSTETSFKTLAQ